MPVAASAAGITVRLGGSERHLDGAEVDAAVDQPAGSYLLRAAGTDAYLVAHPPALSMRRLVTLAGGSPRAASFVTIERPNGTLSYLRRPDLADQPLFIDGPPIVWMDAGRARYLRPLRSVSDVNAADNIGAPGGDLQVRVHHGRLLTVRARADRRQVPAGEPVGLTAEIDGRTGSALSFAWTFGDGSRGSGRAVRHRFRAAGIYEAMVTVDGTDDSGGSSDPIRIRVGDPPRDRGDTGGGTGDRRRAPAQGPVRSGGSGGAGATAASSGSAGAVASASPTETPSALAPARAGSTRHTRRSPSRTADGRVVRGTLVAARAGSSSVAGPGASLEAAPAAARRGRDPDSTSWALLAAVLAAAAFVWIGGRREHRGLRVRAEAAR